VLRDYITGRAKANNVRQFIQFNTVVRSYKFRHDAFFILVGQTRKGQLLCL